MIKKISKYGGGNQTPNSIVIHAIGEYIDDGHGIYHATDYLELLKLSAHFFVEPSGEVMQGREVNDIAYHARGHNTNSIGIEFLVLGTHGYESFLRAIKTSYVTDKQYRSGISLVANLMKEYDISDISRHSDLSPGRKVDPGNGFEWIRFLQEIR